MTDNHQFPNCKVYENRFSGDKSKTKNEVKKAYIQQNIESHLEKLTYLELVEPVLYGYNKKETSIK